MICKFTSISTVFQSYQDDGRVIMKGCVQGNPFTVEKTSPRAGLELGTARSVGQRLITELLGLHQHLHPRSLVRASTCISAK